MSAIPALPDDQLRPATTLVAGPPRFTRAAAGVTARNRSDEERRVRRLFAALDHVAAYTAGYPDRQLLAQSWARISEFLLHSDRHVNQDLHAVRAAVAEAGRHQAGSSAWWAAVRAAALSWDGYYEALSRDHR